MHIVGQTVASRDLGSLEAVGSKSNSSLGTCSVEAIACLLDTVPVLDRIVRHPGGRAVDVHNGENWVTEEGNLDHSPDLADHMGPGSRKDVLVHGLEDPLQYNDRLGVIFCILLHPRVSL